MLFKQFQTKNWKSRKVISFFVAFYCCCGMAVVLFKQKIFLCCIKRQKQRYFRKLTKWWPWLINSQPFELERIFRIKRNCRPFFLFSTIQSFMAGFFYVLILPKEPQAFTANWWLQNKNKRYYKSFNIVNWIIYKKWLFTFFSVVICFLYATLIAWNIVGMMYISDKS